MQSHPEPHLVELICFGFVLRCEIQEQLLDIPVEQSAQICLKIEGDEAEIVQLLARAIVGHVLHQRLHRVDLDVCSVIEENRGDEAAER